MGVGQTVESLTGVPSSYLTALDNMQRDAEQSAARRQQTSGNISDTAVSLRRLAERIDCADCQGALLELDPPHAAREPATIASARRTASLFFIITSPFASLSLKKCILPSLHTHPQRPMGSV